MALDQEALDEHVRVTGGELDNVDDFMGSMLRDRGMDRQGMERGPMINKTVTDICNVTMTRPSTTPDVSERIVLFSLN